MTTISNEPSSKVSLWYDPRVRSIVSQVILVVLIAWGFYELITNTIHNMQRLKIASGFDFLWTNAGFTLIQSLIPYDETATYGRAFIAGLLNTVYVAGVGIILATILGFIIGVARLSKNWVISRVSTVYVEAQSLPTPRFSPKEPSLPTRRRTAGFLEPFISSTFADVTPSSSALIMAFNVQRVRLNQPSSP